MIMDVLIMQYGTHVFLSIHLHSWTRVYKSLFVAHWTKGCRNTWLVFINTGLAATPPIVVCEYRSN